MKNRQKRTAKDYKVEKVIETIKIIHALEGAKFEPVDLKTIIQRVGILPELDREIKPDAANRILLTLELLGWVRRNELGQWLLGSKILRYSNRYSEIVISSTVR